jgi:hypothetical protein
VTGLFRQIFKKRMQTESTQYVRVWVGGQYVKLTPSQARRYKELERAYNDDR